VLVEKAAQAQAHVGALEFQKAEQLSILFHARDEMNLMQEKLKYKYGRININIKDGTFSVIEDKESVEA